MGRHSSLLKKATQQAKSRPNTPSSSQPKQAKHIKAQNKYRFKFDRNHVKNIRLKLPSRKVYSCQLSLSIILYARSVDTLRIIRHDDDLRSIEAEHHQDSISFLDLFLDGDYSPIPVTHLDMLEERLVTALSALHANRIFYPISARQVGFLQPCQGTPDGTEPRLYLQYNKKAKWASNKLPETWQADQLSHARCLFRVLKLLLRLSTSCQERISFNLQEQRDLETYIRKLGPPSHHIDLIINFAGPMTARLASEVMLYLVKNSKTGKACVFFNSLFGACLPLVGPKASPDAICEFYIQQRLDQYKAKSGVVVDKDLEDAVVRFTPATLAVFICCRAEIASNHDDFDKEQWWLMAKNFTGTCGPRDAWKKARGGRDSCLGLP